MNWFHILWLHIRYVAFLHCLMWLQHNQGSVPSWMAVKERQRALKEGAAYSDTVAHVYVFSLRFGCISKAYLQLKMTKVPSNANVTCKGNKMWFKQTKRRWSDEAGQWERGSSTGVLCCYASKQNKPLTLSPYMMLSFMKPNKDSPRC